MDENIVELIADNNIEELKSIISNLNDIDYKLYGKYTLLMTAVMYNKLDIVEMLLENGANTEIENPRGETPLYIVCKFSKNNMEYYENIQLNIIKVLLKYGAIINKMVRFGGTSILNGAISDNNINKIKLLLKNGADPNLGDDKNNRPIHEAATIFSDNSDVIKLLLLYGADINSKNIMDATPLHFACIIKNKRNINTLLEYGADPYIKDIENYYIMNNPMFSYNIIEYVGNKIYELHKLNVAYDLINIANGLDDIPLNELTDDKLGKIYEELMMMSYDPEKTRIRMEEDLIDIRTGFFIQDINLY